MNKIPNELLEKVLDFIDDEESIMACRFVSSRFNQVAVRRWRELHSKPVTFLTELLIREFRTDMDFRIFMQDFPYSKFRFTNLNPENIVAAKNLLVDYARFITHVTIDDFSGSFFNPRGPKELFTEFLASFNSMMNLKYICIKSNPESFDLDDVVIVPFELLQLKILITPKLPPSNRIVQSILRGSPNLDVFETGIDVLNVAVGNNLQNIVQNLVWPLPDMCKAIRTIYVNLYVRALVDAGSTAIKDLSDKLVDEWKNIKVKIVSIQINTDHPNLIPETTHQVQRIIDAHAESITAFLLGMWPSAFGGHLLLPEMPNLKVLDITFHHNRNPIQQVIGNQFANLKSVTLQSLIEPANVFRNAVLESVEHFVLRASISGGDALSFTRWDQTFPNLKTFKFQSDRGTQGYMNSNYLEFIVTHMRMASLTSVKYLIHGIHGTANTSKAKKDNAYINNIFSGFENSTEVADEARLKEEEGKDAENEFWTLMDEKRRPCLANMSGLKHFYFDQPIDDDFATLVLLRMPPLDLLTICSEKLSLRVFCQVIARHKSFCSIKAPNHLYD